jgi:hypothetical protein
MDMAAPDNEAKEVEWGGVGDKLQEADLKSWDNKQRKKSTEAKRKKLADVEAEIKAFEALKGDGDMAAMDKERRLGKLSQQREILNTLLKDDNVQETTQGLRGKTAEEAAELADLLDLGIGSPEKRWESSPAVGRAIRAEPSKAEEPEAPGDVPLPVEPAVEEEHEANPAQQAVNTAAVERLKPPYSVGGSVEPFATPPTIERRYTPIAYP